MKTRPTNERGPRIRRMPGSRLSCTEQSLVTYFGGVSVFGFFGAPFFLLVDFFAGGLFVSA